ncbi:MAG: isoprenylcysteine carboxylmethyltransferase family protein [Pirellulaceae bacterium]|nr:isoprenylcysteine carboxylmethyltransferase family protein [Pirellulaceae bacterium]
MARYLFLIYGVISYGIGLTGILFFGFFLNDQTPFWVSVDESSSAQFTPNFLINTGLLLLFGLQHSVMARHGFKRHWTRLVSPVIERSTYVLLSGFVLMLICVYWRPLPGTVWITDKTFIRSALTTLQAAGWILAAFSSCLINPLELLGLQQVYNFFTNQPEPTHNFTDRYLYKWVRHPIQLGILLGLWSAPTMTISRLMLSAGMTVYIFIGLHFEERDLVNRFGLEYLAYRSKVRQLIPVPKRKPRPTSKID